MSLQDNTQISSAQDGEVAPLPAQVSQPPPPQREMDTHTAHKNFIDSQLYFQNIFKANVLWSTSDPSGKLLIYWQLHPKDINPLIAYLSPLYHMWKGGMTVEMRVIGTAFHAGLLVGVALPPDVHPESLVENKGWSAYNWHAIDPKCQDMITIEIPDINQGMFHYTDDNKGFENNWRGGYFACYVDSPLNTTTSGTPQIHVQFWCKPHRDFHFAYMRIPRPIQNPAEIPPALATALDFYNFGARYPYTNNLMDKMKFLPASVKVSTWSPARAYDLSGKLISKPLPDYNTRAFRLKPGSYTFTPVSQPNNQFTINIKTYADMFPVPKSFGTDQGSAYYTSATGVEGFEYYGLISNGVIQLVCVCNSSQYEVIKQADVDLKFFHPVYRSKTKMLPPLTTFTQVTNESFVVFDYEGNGNVEHHQTNLISEACESKTLANWLPPGQCALFRLIDVDEALPIGYLKLYSEGYFTTTKTDASVEFLTSKIRATFESFIGRTVPIPSNAEFSKNRFAISAYHKSISDQNKIDLSD